MDNHRAVLKRHMVGKRPTAGNWKAMTPATAMVYVASFQAVGYKDLTAALPWTDADEVEAMDNADFTWGTNAKSLIHFSTLMKHLMKTLDEEHAAVTELRRRFHILPSNCLIDMER